MTSSVVTVLLVLIGVALVVLGRRVSARRAVVLGAGVAAIFLAVVVLGSSVVTIVGTRQVGIATAFNRPTGQTFNNGLHFKAPWVQVHEMDGAVQIDTYQAVAGGDRRIPVRLGNNSTALADASIRWQIKPDSADELFVQYKTFDGVRVNLIERNLKVALNEAFAKFDPLDKKNLEESPLPSIAAQALSLLRSKVGKEVEILDVSVPTIDYDDRTEERINQINEERANTTKAGQEVETNKKKREAAEELAKMPPPDLRISIANCLNKMAETGKNLNCFPIGQGVVPTLSIPNPITAPEG
ncbi:SPFH domain-containing protein [Mycobacteroides salmoniphilum]|uniref:SPFH domain-containing protein n=1 Tax=Mycobacteroides salmoniphilum TaxID=404941 RepID=UPI0010668252|nr:SPFH domain-containing protein [Mycobacteroides salmoniphilum]TDZ98055.1 SPFH domain / Band 7 family protein [Mycobacteroides salmoniphilum]